MGAAFTGYWMPGAPSLGFGTFNANMSEAGGWALSQYQEGQFDAAVELHNGLLKKSRISAFC